MSRHHEESLLSRLSLVSTNPISRVSEILRTVVVALSALRSVWLADPPRGPTSLERPSPSSPDVPRWMIT